MKQTNKAEQFANTINKMLNLYIDKNEMYGDSFSKVYKELGPRSGLVPLYNKLHRITSLLSVKDIKFESVEDSFIDLANYAIMNLIELYSKQDFELGNKPSERVYHPMNPEQAMNDIKF